MALTILGLSGALSHDPSAALYIDGKLVAAAEEERFVRDKHAKNRMPYESAKFCLEQAGIKPSDVDVVAIPFAPISLFGKARWHYAKRYWYAPDRALDAILMGNRRYKRYRKKIVWCRSNWASTRRRSRSNRSNTTWPTPPAPTTARASRKDRDPGYRRQGEYATTFFGYGENGKIHKIKEFYDPDSWVAYMARSPSSSVSRCSMANSRSWAWRPMATPTSMTSPVWPASNGELVINTEYANVIGLRRYKEKGKGFYFSPKLIEWLGPKREGDIADEPYIHYAASMQALFEKLALQMIDYYLGDILKQGGKLAFAGGCALNVKLNQKIIARPDVKELFVQPASGDAGTAVGAAAYVSHARGVPVEDGARLPRPFVLQRRRDRRLCPSSKCTEMAQDRRHAAAHRQDHGRWQPSGLVPGPHGVRPACAGWSFDHRLPERAGRGRPDQRADQVPRTLETLLPVDARHCRAADDQGRSPRAVHDLHLRGRRGMENPCTRGGPRGRHLSRPGAQA